MKETGTAVQLTDSLAEIIVISCIRDSSLDDGTKKALVGWVKQWNTDDTDVLGMIHPVTIKLPAMAEIAGVTTNEVRKWIRAGQVPGVINIGKASRDHYEVGREVFVEWLKKQKKQ
jgi:hypothetical protein